jgi:predicted secreted hydrolase
MKRTSLLLLFSSLALLLASCGFPGIPSTSTRLPQVNASPTPTVLPPVRFPQDEAAHRDLSEWWYYTGHFNALMPNGTTHHYGFELVFFQALRSTFPPVYAAHFAISDVTGGAFHFDQRRQTEPDATLPNGTSSAGINVAINDWSVKGVNGLDHLTASMPGYTLHVDLQGLTPATLHNGNGIITFSIGGGGFSYYYSRTRMALIGTLVDHGQSLKVTGEAWMDHQWGNFISLGGGGWDWFSLQLSDSTEMMIYILRDALGHVTSTYIDYILPDAQEQLFPASVLHVIVLHHWKSPITGANYPSGWQLDIHAPQLQASLTLQPELENQELVVYQSTGNSYWEGAVSIQGRSQGKSISGEGYVELTGYAPA